MDSFFGLPAGHTAISTIAALFGLLIGSFLNVVIYRVPKMMERDLNNFVASQNNQPLPHQDAFNLVVPRSACPHCGHQISALKNIPVISYLVLRGRCAACKAPISIRYPMVEMLTALVSFAMIWHFGSGIAGLASLIFAWFLISLALIDIDTQLLPDDLTLPLMWIGLLVNTQSVFCTLNDAVVGAAVGYLILWGIYWAFKLLTGKEGMGYGDFKLLAALGAWYGWSVIPATILVSSLLGAVVGGALILSKRQKREVPFAFGPFLAFAGLLMLPFGARITQYYLGFPA